MSAEIPSTLVAACGKRSGERWPRRRVLQYGAMALGAGIVSACGSDRAAQTDDGLDRIILATDWVAQAEHGGFYQAIAQDIYRDAGLDVSIRMGGPQSPTSSQLLLGGLVDFAMSNGTSAINAAIQQTPTVTVAAMFQRDPRCIITHPDPAIQSLADLKGRPIYVTPQAVQDFWPVLAQKYGFTDDQRRPYNFNPAPFLADPRSAQQGYVTSEPFAIERQGGFVPQVFLLADYGYTPYATTIETTRDRVQANPDLVRRFVQASARGWYSYLDNPEPGNALIRADYPQMTTEQVNYGYTKLREYGIILSGEAETQGIGVMTAARWREFFEAMAAVGVFAADAPYQDAFTLEFVDDLPTAA